VTIADDHPPVAMPAAAEVMARTRAASIELDAIDPDESGRSDYRGPLLADLQFAEWSRSALLRVAEEVCLQGHLLTLSFIAAVQSRVDTDEEAIEFARKQFTGVAGVAAGRIRAALDLGRGLDDVKAVLALHPALLPYAYVRCEVDGADRPTIRLARDTGAVADGAWPTMLDAEHLGPLNAIVRAVDPRLRCEAVSNRGDELTVEVVVDDTEAPEPEEVILTRFSTGTDFVFENRGTPVEIRRG
jgi:hypothetical protein